jgi:hypothetical protein
MRRLALLAPVVLAGALALTGCSGGGPAGDAAAKSSPSAKSLSPATVIDGMHYVQLFHVVDPVVAKLDDTGNGLPPTTDLRTAADSLHQFAVQARKLPTPSGSGGNALGQLAAASSTLAGQLDTLAAKGTVPSDATERLSAALSAFRSAAASARQVAGLPAVVVNRSPHADTGP